MLFDDVLWPSRARSEHDGFVDALEGHGVLVHHFDDLLAETLAIPAARDMILDDVCAGELLGALSQTNSASRWIRSTPRTWHDS